LFEIGGVIFFYVLKKSRQKFGHRLLLLGIQSAWRTGDKQEHMGLVT
jgi:hypothetical protein